VARACAGFMDDPIDSEWLGFAFESLIINEVRAFNHYLKRNRNLFYYKFNDGYEIDLVIEKSRKSLSTQAKYLAIEIKLSKRWDKRWNEALYDFQARSKGRVTELIGVYNGSEIIEFQNKLKVLPAEIFLTLLSEGKII
jgi:predicted AAA+ superfamily ATPase